MLLQRGEDRIIDYSLGVLRVQIASQSAAMHAHVKGLIGETRQPFECDLLRSFAKLLCRLKIETARGRRHARNRVIQGRIVGAPPLDRVKQVQRTLDPITRTL